MFMRCVKLCSKWRTHVLQATWAVLVIEDVLLGKKPHELSPWDRFDSIAGLGVMLIILGASLRLWARGHFTKGTLFTGGPYAMIRHPLYLGSSLIMFGVLCVLNDWINWLVMVPMIIVFHGAAIIYEEESLAKRFGQAWHEYQRSVPAIVPALRWPVSTSGARWSWRVYRDTTEMVATILFWTLPLWLELLEEMLF